ncbi:N-acetylmuramoyl-L-alanine amidase [Massilia sp. NR 4-1]|uniref:N-acetylmuramoyl-L-alanine amidase n=1 Tax=Massilia sp. NR 4-1 TaxID=1678028 RepID=UPI00067D2263|nr:N-acetylmuramoyl-L-alanine amidase [Massilia sp. NR 4-1]
MPAFRRLVFLLPICLLTACASIPRVDRSLSSPDQSSRVKYLVLHYTVTDTPRSIHIFTGHSQGQASIHYLLTDAEQPVIHGIVDESRAAYHAGSDSGWKNDRQLNLTSIGIEIVNAGWVDGPNGRTWAPFPEKQIDTLIPLVKDIMARHHIAPEHVLGHSDIAPQRKQDPGALFPWKRLAAEGLVPWPDEAVVASRRIQYEAELPDLAWFQRKLAQLGYVAPQDAELNQATRNVLIAFQTRYRPSKIDGQPDAETAALLDSPMLVRVPNTGTQRP